MYYTIINRLGYYSQKYENIMKAATIANSNKER